MNLEKVTAMKKLGSIDITPTWTALMPALIAALTNGTKEGREIARAELMRLAGEVDKLNSRGSK